MESSRDTERQPLLHDSDSSHVEVRTSYSRTVVRTSLVLAVLGALVTIVVLAIFVTQVNDGTSTAGEYKSGVVVSDHETCSKIGSDIMRYHNGSAVDAAIATVLCTGVTGAQASGIGGGHFMTIYDTPRGGNRKEVVSINGRAVAPAAASRDMFQNISASLGALTVALPGEVKGLFQAWKRFGRLPWKQLVKPTIDLCVHGFTVSKTLAEKMKTSSNTLKKFEGTRSVFLKADGSPYREGEVMRRPVLGVTLQRLAEDGPESFYTGRVATDIIEDLTEAGGILTAEDLRNYEAPVEHPMVVPLRTRGNESLDLYVPNLPSGGPILQFLLRVLQGYHFDDATTDDLKRNAKLHQVLAETFKFGFAIRSFLGDDNFSDMTEPMNNLTSDDFVDLVRSRLDLAHTHNYTYYGSAYLPAEDHGTSQLTVVAPDGGAVAVTTSVNGYFGSYIYGRRTGILFNNDMDDFSSPFTNNEWGIRPSAANFIAPGKRPLSSMTPAIVLDHMTKMPRLVIGGAGGSKITTMVALTSYLHLMLGVDILDAIDFPRVHHQLFPDHLSYEPRVNTGVLASLAAKGHILSESGHLAVVCGTARLCEEAERCVYKAVGDHRRHSVPHGWS